MSNQTNSLALSKKTNYITKVGILSCLAFILYMIEAPVPLFPSFLQIDLSEIPVIIGTVVLGPAAGIMIELIKNVIHLSITKTQGIGEFANFSVGCAYVVAIWLGHKVFKSEKFKLGKQLILGGIIMALFASVFNYFVLIPLYASILGFNANAIVGMSHAANPMIKNLATLIAIGIFPFNILKAIVVGSVSYVLIKRIGKNLL
jgi:riboflavin transporter FmnP